MTSFRSAIGVAIVFNTISKSCLEIPESPEFIRVNHHVVWIGIARVTAVQEITVDRKNDEQPPLQRDTNKPLANSRPMSKPPAFLGDAGANALIFEKHSEHNMQPGQNVMCFRRIRNLIAR